jgi:hypothetical protein
VDAFNNYFNRIADNIHNQIKQDGVGNYITYMSKAFGNSFPKIKIVKTTSIEIENIIESLKSSHTHGYDEISKIILKACKVFVSVPLSYLCNRALFEGIFPDRLKYATIAPVYKKGDRNILSNYSISILMSFNKIFEKVHSFVY